MLTVPESPLASGALELGSQDDAVEAVRIIGYAQVNEVNHPAWRICRQQVLPVDKICARLDCAIDVRRCRELK